MKVKFVKSIDGKNLARIETEYSEGFGYNSYITFFETVDDHHERLFTEPVQIGYARIREIDAIVEAVSELGTSNRLGGGIEWDKNIITNY